MTRMLLISFIISIILGCSDVKLNQEQMRKNAQDIHNLKQQLESSITHHKDTQTKLLDCLNAYDHYLKALVLEKDFAQLVQEKKTLLAKAQTKDNEARNNFAKSSTDNAKTTWKESEQLRRNAVSALKAAQTEHDAHQKKLEAQRTALNNMKQEIRGLLHD